MGSVHRGPRSLKNAENQICLFLYRKVEVPREGDLYHPRLRNTQEEPRSEGHLAMFRVADLTREESSPPEGVPGGRLPEARPPNRVDPERRPGRRRPGRDGETCPLATLEMWGLDRDWKDQNKGKKQVLPYLTVKESPRNVRPARTGGIRSQTLATSLPQREKMDVAPSIEVAERFHFSQVC